MVRFWLVFLFLTSPLAAAPRRVVSLLPSHSEIVVALGAGDLLVGVSDVERAGDFPGVPRVGGLTPRWEALVAWAPDLILADSAHERYASDFERFHLPVRFLPATHAKTTDDVFKLIRDISQLIDRPAQGKALVLKLHDQLAQLDRSVPPGPRPRAFFEIWGQPLQGVAPGSLQGHLLTRAGFNNIVPDTRNEMPLISSEWVAEQRPDVLFFTEGSSADRISARPGWQRIPAVKKNRMIHLDADLFSRAGPRVVEALAELLRVRREWVP